MSESYWKQIVDREILNIERGKLPLYPEELEELLKRLGGGSQLKRRYEALGSDLNEVERIYKEDLLADPNGDSEIAFLKRVILILIEEIKKLKGVEI